MAFVVWPLIGILTIGILLPLSTLKSQSFIVNNSRFGDKAFSADFKVKDFYKIYVPLYALIAIIIVLAFGFGMSQGFGLDILSGFFFILLYIPIIVLLFMGVYISTLITNLTMNTALLEGGHGFRSTMSPWMRIWIAVSNAILVGVSLGFLFPWARIRTVRYRASQTAVLAASDLNEFASDVSSNQNALGEELGEVFDVEVAI